MKVDLFKLKSRLGLSTAVLWEALIELRDDEYVCRLTNSQLKTAAARHGLSPNQVMKGLGKLRQAGLVSRVRNGWNNERMFPTYERDVNGRFLEDRDFVEVPEKTSRWLVRDRNWGGERKKKVLIECEDSQVGLGPQAHQGLGGVGTSTQDGETQGNDSASRLELGGQGGLCPPAVVSNPRGYIFKSSSKVKKHIGGKNKNTLDYSEELRQLAEITGVGQVGEEGLTSLQGGISGKKQKSNHWENPESNPEKPNDLDFGKKPKVKDELLSSDTGSTEESGAYAEVTFNPIERRHYKTDEEYGCALIRRDPDWRKMRERFVRKLESTKKIPSKVMRDGKRPRFVLTTPYPPKASSINEYEIDAYLIRVWRELRYFLSGKKDYRMKGYLSKKEDRREEVMAWWRACISYKVRPLDWVYWALMAWEGQGSNKTPMINGILSPRRLHNEKERRIFEERKRKLGGMIRISEVGGKIDLRFEQLRRGVERLFNEHMGLIPDGEIEDLVNRMFPSGREHLFNLIEDEHKECTRIQMEIEDRAKRGEFVWVPPWV